MAHIQLDDVSMTFRVREKYQITLKEYVLRRMFRAANNPLVEIRALRNINLRLGPGDRVGVIGANGSGKSTLLKMLAGVYTPTSGRCTVAGKISSLFELSLGFEMEAAALFFLAARAAGAGEDVRAACILTVSDTLSEEETSEGTYMALEDLERATDRMIEVALEAGASV